LSIDEFKNRIHNNEFVEYEEVYDNIFYGTLKSEIESLITNHNIIFDVDVVGALSLKQYFSSNSLTVFINPPSIDELENRLRRRKNNSEEDLNERLDKAEKEMEMKDKFDQIIINNDLNKSKDEILSVVKGFLNK
jgi:guanylate kinase